MNTDHITVQMASPVGCIYISSDGNSIISVSFRTPEIDALHTDLNEKAVPSCIELCANQLSEYFSGSRRTFDLPLSPAGTEFQQRVWKQLEQIPYGRTISYLDLAKQLGDPKVIRAAGTANGKNPIAIIIPCHRVIGSNGDLVGYGGGLPNKKWLLEHEQQHYHGISQASLFPQS